MGPQPVKTLKETAFDYIKGKIVDGTWEGGTFLAEKMLSEQLGMSKTPIRSALDRLEMMGLVKLSPNQGAVVQEVSLKKISEIYQFRLALETFAVRLLTGKLDAGFFVRMDENLALQQRAIDRDDIPAYVALDRDFHESIIGAMDNEELTEAMARIHDKFLIAVRVTFLRSKWRLQGSIEEHRQIRNALAGSDPDATEQWIRHHIEFVKQTMF